MRNVVLIVTSILTFLSSRLLTLTLLSPPPPYHPSTCHYMSTGTAASTKKPVPFCFLLLHLYVSLDIEFGVF